MSLEALKAALDELDEPTYCEGQVRLYEQLAIMLPDGDVGAVGDPGFVDWLVEHGEPAPFGHAGETRIDKQVRHAVRLVARGAATVSGFDPGEVLGDISRALCPHLQLEATLTDVLVYPTGGHFARHKDTPRAPNLLGTLVVEVPIEHTGGAFRVEDVLDTHVIDWSGPVDPFVVRWVAVFSDAEHEIEMVTSGNRVTLVYSLGLSDLFREDNTHRERIEEIQRIARGLELPEFRPLMIACTRHIIGLDSEQQPQGIGVLRGADYDIALALQHCGYDVKVRTCVAARSAEYDEDGAPPRFSSDTEIYFARLRHPLLDHDVAQLLAAVTFEREPWGDGGGFDGDEASTLAPFVLDTVPVEWWIVRRTAAATFLRATNFADDGYVGNAAFEAYLYKLAALEVTRKGRA